MRSPFLIFLVFALMAFSCKDAKSELSDSIIPEIELETQQDTIYYLALGDSYTIGESVPSNENFPNQLGDSLRNKNLLVEEVKIIARTGWTTNELQDAINKEQPDTNKYNLVTLLIGVNNQYRGYPISQFEKEFTELLNQAIKFAGGDPKRVVVVSIPDYGVTPFAQGLNPEKIGREIDAYNELKQAISENLQVPFVNITPFSRTAIDDASLIAGDRLHPSGKMYTQWVRQILPEVMMRF